ASRTPGARSGSRRAGGAATTCAAITTRSRRRAANASGSFAECRTSAGFYMGCLRDMPEQPEPKHLPFALPGPPNLVLRRTGDSSRIRYAELHCATNFSFLEGASHGEELVAQAAELGLTALAITDRNSVAGVVRAHIAAKEIGVKIVIGALVTPIDAPPVLL